MMLTGGDLPFFHENPVKLIDIITKKEPSFSHKGFSTYSTGALELVKQMLTKDPN